MDVDKDSIDGYGTSSDHGSYEDVSWEEAIAEVKQLRRALEEREAQLVHTTVSH